MEEEKKEVAATEEVKPEAPAPEIKVEVSEMNEEEVQLEKADAKYTASNIQVLEGKPIKTTIPIVSITPVFTFVAFDCFFKAFFGTNSTNSKISKYYVFNDDFSFCLSNS